MPTIDKRMVGSPSVRSKIELETLRLSRCGNAREAGLWSISLPWPQGEASTFEYCLDARPTTALPIGRWPESNGSPRRWLLMADGRNESPVDIVLQKKSANVGVGVLPELKMELLESLHEPFRRDRHRLTVKYGDRSIGLALGLRSGGRIHWWEACRLITLDRSEGCVSAEMGGAIEVLEMTREESLKYSGYSHPFLHRHNWLNGRIFIRAHANGVCEIFAHHINSQFFDEGSHFEDVVPVIGFYSDASKIEAEEITGVWDGTITEFAFGDVRFDVTESARLATPEQPGRMSREDGVLIWQPYHGVELYGGDCPVEKTGDPFIYHAEKREFPKGMARTIRFSLSLSDRSPYIMRYQASREWYEACGELPAIAETLDSKDQSLETAREWVRNHIVQGGFEDGSLPRHLLSPRTVKGRVRFEPGWEGEFPYALFLSAWQTGDAQEYASAMRAAYYFTDVIVDHAVKRVRMHGFAPPAVSLPMNRVQGTIAAYLETGDPYLLETAEAVTTNSHWQHRNSWPRMTMGRDACYIRSAVLLYRYFGEEYFRSIAYEGAIGVVETQRENGSFGDQGGGSGIHQWGGYLSKPWMGLLAVNGLLDYLELFPEEEIFKQCVRRFADWLMSERQQRNGGLTWCFQHDFDGQRRVYHNSSGKWIEMPSVNSCWHHETIARLMQVVSSATQDPSYLEAWRESHRIAATYVSDHAVSAALQFLKDQS